MPLPKLGIGEWFKKAAEGAGGGILKGASELVSKFVTDPTAKMEAEKELETLRIKHIERLAELSLDGDRIEADLEKAYLADVDSARQMQIQALQQDDKFSKRFVYYLAIGVITMTFAFDLCFFFIQYPERNHDIINMIAGTLNSTGFAAIIYFFFGSSKSSQNKQDTIDRLNSVK